MCGRYQLSRRKQIIEEHFDSVPTEEDWNPRYNIAPTQPVPVIRQNPKATDSYSRIATKNHCAHSSQHRASLQLASPLARTL